MRSMSLITPVFLLVVVFAAFQDSDSPHGKDFRYSCDLCHSAESWELDKEIYAFQHDSTVFPLTGQHRAVECRQCHLSLVFLQAETECVECHADMHNQTVGMDCGRCHHTQSWIVPDISEIHRQGRFPLVGAHLSADCYQCHPSASALRFEPLGVACYDCHQAEYLATTNPDHAAANYSTNCEDCHNIYAFDWAGSGIDHSFFPLEQGHDIANCNQCHTPGTDYSNISAECYSCHEADYNASENPAHATAEFSTNCTECHSIAPGWKPAGFQEHDGLYFPIYSGEHAGEWGSCTECHPSPSNYAVYTCIDCHEHNQGDMDEEHDEVPGYVYESTACFECHPTGSGEESFDHGTTNFPLTGAHITTGCIECHEQGYESTPMDCVACHEQDFTQSENPPHAEIGLSNDCAVCHTTEPGWAPATFEVHNEYYPLTGAHLSISNECAACHDGDYINTPNACFGCHEQDYNQSEEPEHAALDFPTACEDCHTTNPGWEPATFDIHDDYYPLEGAHAVIAGNCAACHANGYQNTPNTCFGCHEEDYNQTADPPHEEAQFSTDCLLCHNQSAWEPSTFDHDAQYFPIYSGSHQGEWNSCSECHTNPNNYADFSCIDCHEHNQADMDDEHDEVSGYVYNSMACYECHPNGEEPLHMRQREIRKLGSDIKF